MSNKSNIHKRLWTREYRRTHPNYVEAGREYVRKRSARIRSQVRDMLGAKCVSCNLAEPDILQIDHVYGGGTQEQKSFGGSGPMYWYYLNHPEEAKLKLQLLCPNCNMRKKHLNKEYGRNGGRPRKQN